MILSLHGFVLSLILFTAPMFQSSSVILEEVQEKYDSIENFTADFKQMTGDGHFLSGKFFYQSSDKFRIELDRRMLISDGELVWNYSPNIDKVVISPVDDSGTSFSMDDYIYNYPENCTVSYEIEDKFDVIVLKPKNAELDFKEVKLWVNSNKIIEQLQMIDLMNSRFKVTLSNIKVNTEVNDDLFTFTPKEGTKVIDLR